jgi:hypothetical protein
VPCSAFRESCSSTFPGAIAVVVVIAVVVAGVRRTHMTYRDLT